MNKVYNVMVVEDEKIEREALAMMIRYNCRHIGTVQTAENGVEALEKLKAFHPDIIFMDIQLPGINGLDMIKLIRQNCPTVHFVIISAYNQFEYAREAIRLGVHDFLTKPVTVERISKTFLEIIERIEQDEYLSRQGKLNQERIMSIRPVLESDCVLSIASMKSSTPINKILDFMQINANSGFVFMVRNSCGGTDILKRIKFRINSTGTVCFGEKINELCVFVVFCEENLSKIRVEEMMNYVAELMNLEREQYCIGVGKVVFSMDELHKSYEDSLAVMSYLLNRQEKIGFIEDVSEINKPTVENLVEVSTSICNAMKKGETQHILESLTSFFTQLQLSGKNLLWMSEQAYQLYILIYNNFPEISSEEFCIPMKSFFSCEDIKSIYCLMSEHFCKMEQLIKEDKDASFNDIVTNVLQIMEMRYMENLSLENIAEELNFSIFYISKLFKKQVGITFTEYLTKMRIEKAQELLAENKLSIKEIAYAVGYNSQGYFTKIFRKYTGISPSKYQN